MEPMKESDLSLKDLKDDIDRMCPIRLYINDKLVLAEITFPDTKDFKTTTSDGEYFVMGDNREVSKDSRMLGNFTEKEIVGKVNVRLFPFNKIGIVK